MKAKCYSTYKNHQITPDNTIHHAQLTLYDYAYNVQPAMPDTVYKLHKLIIYNRRLPLKIRMSLHTVNCENL